MQNARKRRRAAAPSGSTAHGHAARPATQRTPHPGELAVRPRVEAPRLLDPLPRLQRDLCALDAAPKHRELRAHFGLDLGGGLRECADAALVRERFKDVLRACRIHRVFVVALREIQPVLPRCNIVTSLHRWYNVHTLAPEGLPTARNAVLLLCLVSADCTYGRHMCTTDQIRHMHPMARTCIKAFCDLYGPRPLTALLLRRRAARCLCAICCMCAGACS